MELRQERARYLDATAGLQAQPPGVDYFDHLVITINELRKDKALLDSGSIRLMHADDMGNPAPCIHTQLDLRASIRAATIST